MSARPILDLDTDSRDALGFDRLLGEVAVHSATPMGRRRVLDLAPTAESGEARARQQRVAEARAELAQAGSLVPRMEGDPEPALRLLGVGGMRLDLEALRAVAVAVDAAADLRFRLGQREPGTREALAGPAGELSDLSDEARPVLRGVDPEGRLTDNASPELGRIRRERTRVAQRLRKRLESLVRDPGLGAVIQDDFITQRNGRYVIPVRTDAPRPVRGIVHAGSASGATRFIEPLESVELNNDLVRLEEAEREEEARILDGWTEGFRRRRDEVTLTLSALARFDAIQARARFAEETAGVVPTLGDDQPLRLRQARHPLLEKRLAEEGGSCVPLDLELDPADRALVISGPNTGGKTVALKTVGLCVLMAQTGIPLPALEARLPVYAQLRADIGDHQSIQADLSTFSSHIHAIAGFLAGAEAPLLLLLDELGTGTEPAEGAALAQALLESMLQAGWTTLATTHHGALKAWASLEERAVNAAMEFDRETLRPTYRVLMDTAGVSAGIDIARRLGLPGEVIARAGELLGPDASRAEAYLERLQRLQGEAEEHTRIAAEGRVELERRRAELEESAQRKETARATRVERELDNVLESFRRRSDAEVQKIRDKQQRRKAERDQARAAASLRTERHQRAGEIAPAPAAPGGGWAAATTVAAGDAVRVRSLGREGVVRRVRGSRIEVQLGRVGFTVALDDLEVLAGGAPPQPASPPPRRFPEPRAAEPVATERSTEQELKLLGLTVDEALSAVDRYLDGAALAGFSEVRLIHGHGTGRLRSAVREYLVGHPHVDAQRPGGRHEGGDGATVVRLK